MSTTDPNDDEEFLGDDDELEDGETGADDAPAADPDDDLAPDPAEAEAARQAAMQKRVDELAAGQLSGNDLRTAITEGFKQIATTVAPRTASQPAAPAPKTKEQRDAENAELIRRMTEDPTGVIEEIEARVEGRIRKQVVGEVAERGRGALEAGGEVHIGRYLRSMEGKYESDKRAFLGIARAFEEAIPDNHRVWLSTATSDERKQYFSSMWKQAAGDVYIRGLDKRKDRARNISAGGGVGSGSASGGRLVAPPGLDDLAWQEVKQTARALATRDGVFDRKIYQENLRAAGARVDKAS